MAAFSYQIPNPNLVFFPNITTTSLPHHFPSTDQTLHPTSRDSKFQESSCLDHSDNDNSIIKKQSTHSSTVSMVDYKLETGGQVFSHKSNFMDRKRKTKHMNPSFTSAQSKGAREGGRSKKQKKCNGVPKENEGKEGPKADKKDQRKAPDDEEPPKGYIHVRARRGQATDSHSLAERVRREKISERMKILQKLVPGCDKVTGKALMLDEIINYVQSLQNQVEFLSLKLAAVNPMFYDFGLDAFMIRPQGLNSLASPLPCLQQCSPNQSTAFADTTTLAQISPQLLDAAVLLHPGQCPNAFPEENDSVLRDVDNHRKLLLNSAGLISDNLCSFH